MGYLIVWAVFGRLLIHVKVFNVLYLQDFCGFSQYLQFLNPDMCSLFSVPGRCALRRALDQGQKEIVTLLLRVLVSKKISNAAGSFAELTEIKEGKYRSTLSKLGAVFPDLYLQVTILSVM